MIRHVRMSDHHLHVIYQKINTKKEKIRTKYVMIKIKNKGRFHKTVINKLFQY